VKTAQPETAVSVVTDPLEIASIRRGGRMDIVGWRDAADVYWYAYTWSLERYRERQRRAVKARAKMSWWQRMLARVRGFWSREGAK
jgi:hypothetical protein